jgi:hypothetical protein
MAIREFSSGSERRGIVCVGRGPAADLEKRAFTDRGYKLMDMPASSLTDTKAIGILDSVIFSQRATNPTRVVKELEQFASKLLDSDCRVYVRVATSDVLQGYGREIVVNGIRRLGLPVAGLSPAERQAVPLNQREREGLPLAPYVYVCDVGHTWVHIAQLISDNPAGKPPRLDLSIDARDSDDKELKLTGEQELLVKRAFADCTIVHLRQMQDGLSGVLVFRAHAELAGGLEGRWPILHFVKLGSRRKIGLEYAKYQEHALLYVPFNLGPRLNLARCGLGSHEAIIVGDFVEQAEALKDCASSGRAAQVIGNLFSRTLRAWHNAARQDCERTVFDALSYLFPSAIPPVREPLIRAYGATLTLEQARALFGRCTSRPVLVGTIHGDLNATNVLVRVGDAIVIDFEQLAEGMPLVYDCACVEAGLLVDGFAKDRRELASWLQSIEPLYANRNLYEWQTPCHPKDPSAWFYDCVRQIRLHARQFDLGEDQYATALALAFIKKACNSHVFGDRRDELRAMGFLIAERILKLITA